MNKLELIQELKEKGHLTRDEASKVIKIFFGEMTKAFIKGERVEIRGLCSFYIKDYAPYTGRKELHFFENTVRDMKKMSKNKKVRLGEEEHTVIFHKGNAIEIECPKLKKCKITDME